MTNHANRQNGRLPGSARRINTGVITTAFVTRAAVHLVSSTSSSREEGLRGAQQGDRRRISTAPVTTLTSVGFVSLCASVSQAKRVVNIVLFFLSCPTVLSTRPRGTPECLPVAKRPGSSESRRRTILSTPFPFSSPLWFRRTVQIA